ncbi:MAG: anthranilate/aminodeoxychorismate synthase component II [Desulfocapsa sp.]|nr:MAG: anthranilate/aminodeoxychorismate synthase component II [Desulfocapsa sp.]
MLVIIDNYDSFTYNIVQTIAANFLEAGEKGDIQVFRNDKISIQEIADLQPDQILISPGPCTPSQAGISIETIKHFSGKVPLLGVCLGHQSIAEAFGGDVVRAGRIMHGKTSPVYHNNTGIFSGLENPFAGMRYHSLIVKKETIPDCLEVTAWTEEGEIMGLRHRELQVDGVQFHPESIMTPAGIKLLNNFIEFSK